MKRNNRSVNLTQQKHSFFPHCEQIAKDRFKKPFYIIELLFSIEIRVFLSCVMSIVLGLSLV